MWIPLVSAQIIPAAFILVTCYTCFSIFFHKRHLNRLFSLFLYLSRARMVRQHVFAPNAAVNSHMFCLFLPFLEVFVICWELLLSCKSNFIQPDSACTVLVRTHVFWVFAFLCACTVHMPDWIQVHKCVLIFQPSEITPLTYPVYFVGYRAGNLYCCVILLNTENTLHKKREEKEVILTAKI